MRANRLPMKATSATSVPILYIDVFVYIDLTLHHYVSNRAPMHASERFYRRARVYILAQHVNIMIGAPVYNYVGARLYNYVGAPI